MNNFAPMQNTLPIDEVTPHILAHLRNNNTLTLVAPPGAGKTTKLPLALIQEPWAKQGKILLLEPRRISARAASSRMAKTLNENVGETIGLRVRFSAKVSAFTRLEVMTEGVFTRLILENPALEGISAVIFDEFHERSLDSDFGLALALDCQKGLRDDLKIIVMSATLDGARLSELLHSEVITSEGRAYPLTHHYMGREAKIENVILTALRTQEGSLLVFLPGMGEITRLETTLKSLINDPKIDICPLFGVMDTEAQDLAIQPSSAGRRKIVLATSIAETSLTIEDVRIVIDSGLARVPKYEPDMGITRLETVRASRATITQRAGRAGRTQAGICYRLWDEAQDLSLPAFATPEIKDADLTQLLLDCAAWGAKPQALDFLDSPPPAALNEAHKLLLSLEAIERDGHITPQGKAMRALPLPPRLARMVLKGDSRTAAQLAMILTERGLGGNDINLETRLENFKRDKSERAKEAKRMADNWNKSDGEDNLGYLLSLAYPERIAKARRKKGEFLLANGRGAALEPNVSLAQEEYLSIAELTGSASKARILAAAPLDLSLMSAHIIEESQTYFDTQAQRLKTRRLKRFAGLILHESPLPLAITPEATEMLYRAALKAQLPFTQAQLSLKTRANITDEDFYAALKTFLENKSALADINAPLIDDVLNSLIDYTTKAKIEKDYPSHFEAPTGNRFLINYEGEEPTLSIRVPELYGVTTHPCVGAGKIPLLIELLSPAYRPVQITRDLPAFWRGSYKDVRIDMKGRYPRHPWPEDPTTALPTARAKPRGT